MWAMIAVREPNGRSRLGGQAVTGLTADSQLAAGLVSDWALHPGHCLKGQIIFGLYRCATCENMCVGDDV